MMQLLQQKGVKLANWLVVVKQFLAGMVKDLIPEKVPPDKYIDAENIQLTKNSNQTIGGATPPMGNIHAFDKVVIDFETDGDDYKGYRIPFDLSAPNIDHDFVITEPDGTVAYIFTLSSAEATAEDRYNDLTEQLQLINAGVFVVYIPSALSTELIVVYVGFKIIGFDYTITETIGGTAYDIFVIKEFYGTAANGIVQPLKSLTIGDNQYQICSNGYVIMLNVAVKDETTDAWTYTTLLRTKQIKYASNAVIDLDGQIDVGDRVSLYFTGKPHAPRAFYVTLVDPWQTDYAMIYNENPDYIQDGNPNGHYTYEDIENNTRLQVITNFARVTLAQVNDTGGALTAGDKMVLVQQRLSFNSYTGWSETSNPISIFSDSLTDTRLSGNTGGATTTKSALLTISNLNPDTYDEFRLAVVENIDGVFTAKLIGSYPISAETVQITYTGSEITTDLTFADLTTQQVVFKTAGNLVINRNRLFLSDIETQAQTDLAEWTKTIVVTTERTTIGAVGNTYSMVNEYMSPQNIFDTTGYMYKETYRFGFIPLYKSGLIGQPVFIDDHQITHSSAELTSPAGTTPSEAFVYYPFFTVDLSTAPDVDGIPFADAIYGYSIVRQECKPQILADGYILPECQEAGDYYMVGEGVVRAVESTFGPTDPTRTRLAFLSADILFGQVSIQPIPGDKLILFGQPTLYNTVTEGVTTGLLQLREFAGDFDTAPIELTVGNDGGEIVAFNTEGNVLINGKKYTTDKNADVGLLGGLNQLSISIALDSEYAVAVTSNPDYSFYRALYYRPKSNPYGNENEGTYISCGHFRKVVTGTTSYTENVFGGDVFVQKTYTKFANAYIETLTATADTTSDPITPFTNNPTSYVMVGLMPDGITYVQTQPGVVTPLIPGGLFAIDVNWSDVPEIYWEVQRESSGLYVKLAVGNIDTYYDNNSGSFTSAPTPAHSTSIERRVGISFYSMNRGNYQLRYFDEEDPNLNYPYQTTVLEDWIGVAHEDEPGALLYSISYTPINQYQTFQSYNPDLPVSSVQSTTMYYSQLQIEGTFGDAYRIFLPLDFHTYPIVYGRITNTFRNGNTIEILMVSAVLNQQIDQQAVIQSAVSPALILGDGSVLGARETIVSLIGSPMKTGASQYLSPKGGIYTIWYNSNYNKVLRRAGDGLRDFGAEDQVQSFLTENGKYLGAEWSVVFIYDFYTSEIIMATHADIPDGMFYDIAEPYDAGTLAYTVGAFSTRNYYTALIDVPAGKNPDNIANQFQYWQKSRQSNYTLAFNEQTNAYTGFYSYLPVMGLPYKKTFLSFPSSPGNEPKVYEHNRLTNKFYDIDIVSYITMVFTDYPDMFKRALALMMAMRDTPIYMYVKGNNGTKTYMDISNIKQVRDEWWVDVYNDATINADNPTGANDGFTAQIRGEIIEVTVFFNNSGNTIKRTDMRIVPQKPYFFE